jgi:hypothetical protein
MDALPIMNAEITGVSQCHGLTPAVSLRRHRLGQAGSAAGAEDGGLRLGERGLAVTLSGLPDPGRGLRAVGTR